MNRIIIFLIFCTLVISLQGCDISIVPTNVPPTEENKTGETNRTLTATVTQTLPTQITISSTSTSTSIPTLTLTPTLTPTALPTPTINQETITPTPATTIWPTIWPSDWKIILNDEFDANKNSWPIRSYSNSNWTGEASIIDGSYVISGTRGADAFWYYFRPNESTIGNITDFLVISSMQIVTGNQTTSIGLVFRLDDSKGNYFVFEIKGSQEYRLKKYTGNNSTNVIEWKKSEDIKINDYGLVDYNQLAVLCIGNQFQLFINGVKVDEFTDNEFLTGEIGVFVRLLKQGEHGIWKFLNFTIYAPR